MSRISESNTSEQKFAAGSFQPTPSQSRRYFSDRLRNLKIGSRDQLNVKCPFHDDRTASMSLNLGNGVWSCKGCDPEGGGILAFERKLTGLPIAECWSRINATIGREDRSPQAKRPEYVYHDANGKAVFRSVRLDLPKGQKTFFLQRPDGKGDWTNGLGDVHCVLFNLPAVMKADVVLIAEGEKDALNLQRAAICFPKGVSYAATTNAMGAGKWDDSYSVRLKGKKVYIFGDNDDPGRAHVKQVALSVAKVASNLHVIEFNDLKEHGDVSDYLTEHSADELFALMQAAPEWNPVAPESRKATVWDTAEDMTTFLDGEEEPLTWLVEFVLVLGCLTQIYAPRGLGKSVLMLFWAVKLARAGKRVLLLDKDNPRSTVRSRLISLGGDGLKNLKVITRERCPYLTSEQDWFTFPFGEYDVIIVDSWNSLTPGVAEKDTAASALALKPLLEVCAKGAAVLVIGNTVRSAAHSRVNGVVEDRADLIFELRDGTDLHPSGIRPWVEELPEQGAANWQARSSRRMGRTKLRAALVPTKTRIGPELAPRMLEINFEDEPWLVSDVTADVDAEGERLRLDRIRQKANRHGEGVAMLTREIERRVEAGESPILKTAAGRWLKDIGKFKREEAHRVTSDPAFEQAPVAGRGGPVQLHTSVKHISPEQIPPSRNHSVHAGFDDPHLSRPHPEHTGQIPPSKDRVNGGDSQPAICSQELCLTEGQKTNLFPFVAPVVPRGYTE